VSARISARLASLAPLVCAVARDLAAALAVRLLACLPWPW
jgi:hypothetical protein